MGFVRLSATIVYARNFQASLEFYRDKLGFPVRSEEPNFVEFTGPGNRLALQGDPEREPDATEHPRMQLVFQVRNIEATIIQLGQKGVPVLGNIKEFESGKLAAIMDPDGNVLFLEQRKNEDEDEEPMLPTF